MTLLDNVAQALQGAFDWLFSVVLGFQAPIITILVVAAIVYIVLMILGGGSDKEELEGPVHFDERYLEEVRSGLARAEAERLDETLQRVSALRSEARAMVSAREGRAARRVVESSRSLSARLDAETRQLESKATYRNYLALHYASFTAADGIHEARERMKALRDQTFEERRRLSGEIDDLKVRHAQGARLAREISSVCKKHQSVNALFHIYKESADSLYSLELAQNSRTAELRDYIGGHFGERGRRWYKRIMARKGAFG